MKVKKTDLPVLPGQDILPSLDDDEDDSQSFEDTDEDDMDDEMMADEAATDSDLDDEEYDDDDMDESEQEDDDTVWGSLSTPQIKKTTTSTTTTTTTATPKTTTQSMSTGSNIEPAIDPYFTHFEPHSEHQSFKVNTFAKRHNLLQLILYSIRHLI